MLFLSRLLLWIFSFHFLLKLLQAYSFDSATNTIYDLEGSGSAFMADVSLWYQSSYRTSGVKTSICLGDTLLGGYGVLGGSHTKDHYWERTYGSLPMPHNVIYFTIKIYPIDGWDYAEDDHFEIWFGSIIITAWHLEGYANPYAPNDLCGNAGYHDLRPLWTHATVPHSTNSLVLRVVSSLNQDSIDESLGFREIKMEFQQISSPPSSASFCGVTQGSPLYSNACPCPDGQYMIPPSSGNCQNCDGTCKTCSASGASACLTCPDGRWKSGSTCLTCDSNCQTCSGSATTCLSCPSGTPYLIGTTCYLTCDYPLQQYTVGSVINCKSPCATGVPVWWDQSCGTCAYTDVYGEAFTLQPVIINTFPKCNFPCSTTQVLYFNTSCLSSCPSPLTPLAYKSRNFCAYSCGSSQYLYWNGSCIGSCPWPLSPETQAPASAYPRKFCWYYCQPGEYMYWNGSCISTCPWPLSPETQGIDPTTQRKFCWYLCQPSDFLYWNGSCLNTCSWPLSPETQGSLSPYQRKFCWYTCQPSEFLYWNGSCLSTCPAPLSHEIQGTNPTYKRNFCWYTCQPNEYLFSDKSCLATCDPPLSSETQGTAYQRKFCWSKSGCPSGQFKLSDGSCVGSCPSGYFGSTTLYTCEPCQDSLCSVCSASLGAKCQICKTPNILDSNNVCKDCQALKNEFIKQNDEVYTYQYKLRLSPASCDLDENTVRQYLQPTADSKNLFPPFSFQVNQFTEPAGTKYFLLEIQFDSAVSSENTLVFVLESLQTSLQVPKTPSSTQATADTGVKTTFAAVTGSTVGAGLTLGATAALWSIISFQQFVGYFIYLNIQLPPHLIYFLTMFDNVNLEILPNPLASLTERLAELWDSLVHNNDPKYQLPHKFAEFETQTLFILNAGSTFFACIVLLLMPYLLDLLRKFKPIAKVKFLQTLHSNLRWNIPIRIFLESGIPLTFALLIQMRKISYSNVPYIISAATAGLTFVYLYFMISYISKTLANFKYEDLKDPSVENSIGTLFEGLVMKKEKPLGKYYYALILFRGMLLVFVCVFAEQYPVVQTTTMAIFNLFFVYYVWQIIQFESRYLNWTNRIKEVLILIVEIFFTTLCYLEKERYRNIVGWLTISMLGLTLAMELLFGFYLQMLAVKNFVKRMREHCKKRKKVLVIAPVSTEETFRNILTIETEK